MTFILILISKPNRPLEEVTPYLATLPGIIASNPETRTLTFLRPHGFMTPDPVKVYITQVTDAQEGLELLEGVKDAVNAVWEKRAKLVAVMKPKAAPRHLEVWSLLPQTNCKQCGESTCLAFAVLLIQHKRSLDECVPLKEDASFTGRCAALKSML